MKRSDDTPKVFSTYKDSPLGRFLSDVLKTINDIKKTYPDDRKSREKHRAFLFFQIIEQLVGILNEFLPLFRQGKVPTSEHLTSTTSVWAALRYSSLQPLIVSFFNSPEDIFYLNVLIYYVGLSRLKSECSTNDIETEMQAELNNEPEVERYSLLLDEDINDAKENTVYLFTETRKYYVKGMKEALFLPEEIDLNDLSTKLGDINFKKRILTITSKAGYTEIKQTFFGNPFRALAAQKFRWVNYNLFQAFVDIKPVYSRNEKLLLFDENLQKVKKFQDNKGNIKLDVLIQCLILECLPKAPIFYTFVEKAPSLFNQLPKEFKDLVPFLNPEFYSPFAQIYSKFAPPIYYQLESYPERYELALMSSLPDGDINQAKEDIIYLSETGGEYYVLGMDKTSCLPKNMDLTNLRIKITNRKFKEKILKITSKAGHTTEGVVKILSRDSYQYEMTLKPSLQSPEPFKLIVDFSQGYEDFKTIVSVIFSVGRRYYLSQGEPADKQEKARYEEFRDLETNAIETNNLLGKKLDDVLAEINNGYQQIIPDEIDSLAFSIESIKKLLTGYAQLETYIQRQEKNKIGQTVPVLILRGDLITYDVRPGRLDVDDAIHKSLDHVSTKRDEILEKLEKLLDFRVNNEFNSSIRISDFEESDRLENIQAKIAHNRQILDEVSQLKQNIDTDAQAISAHLETLYSKNSAQYDQIDKMFSGFKALSQLYEERCEIIKTAIKELEDKEAEYQLKAKLSGLDSAVIAEQLNAIQAQIDKYHMIQSPSLLKAIGDSVEPTTVGPTVASTDVELTKKSGPLSKGEGLKRRTVIQRIQGAGHLIFKRASSLSERLFPSGASTPNKISSAEQSKESRQTPEIPASSTPVVPPDVFPAQNGQIDHELENLQAQHTKLKQLHDLSLIYQRFKQQIEAILPDNLPTETALDSINKVSIQLLSAIESTINLDKTQQEALKQQSKALVTNLCIQMDEQLKVKHEALKLQHSNLNQQYNQLKQDTLEENPEAFSSRLAALTANINDFQIENTRFKNIVAQYASCSFLDKLTQSFDPPNLSFDLSLEALQAKKQRQDFIAEAWQELQGNMSIPNQHLVDSLREKLELYLEKGELDSVIEWMQNNRPSDRPLNFKTKWHQMHAKCWDIKYPLEASFNQQEFDKKIINLNGNSTAALQRLYEMLQAMKQQCNQEPEAHQISAFIDTLTQDLEMFVDEKISFHDFQNKFLTKLHSQDELMHQKNKDEAWRYWVGNLVIGVFTLGIALAIQWGYTRFSQGHGVLFFDATAKEQSIKEIELSVKSLSLGS